MINHTRSIPAKVMNPKDILDMFVQKGLGNTGIILTGETESTEAN